MENRQYFHTDNIFADENHLLNQWIKQIIDLKNKLMVLKEEEQQ
jgi:hypothetical protein